MSTCPGTPTQHSFLLYRSSSRFRGLVANPLVCCLKGWSPPSFVPSHHRPRYPVHTGKSHLAPQTPVTSLVTCLRSAAEAAPPHTHTSAAPASGTLASPCPEIYAGMGRGASWGSCNPAEYFPGYLTKLLQNHTAYACDGDYLNLQCPRHSTISVQSAFYGQDYQMCSSQEPTSQREDNLTCVASTTLQVLRFVDVLKSWNRFSLSFLSILPSLSLFLCSSMCDSMVLSKQKLVKTPITIDH